MEDNKSTKNFIRNLYKLISDLERYYPNNNTKKYLQVFDKLDINKILLKIYNSLKKVKEEITKNDTKIFNEPFVLLPNLDLSNIWKNLTNKQQKKVWAYLNVLLLSCDILLSTDEDEEKEQKQEKNLYEGIGVSNELIGVNDLTNPAYLDKTNEKNETNETFNPLNMLPGGVNSMASMLGVDNLIDVSAIKDALNKMSDEDIEQATDEMNKLICNDDAGTSNLMKDILKNIKTELTSNKNLNSMEDLLNTVTNISSKFNPESFKSIDPNKLMKNALNMMNVKDEKGESLFDKKSMDNINSLMNNLVNNKDNPEKYKEQCEEALKNLNLDETMKNLNLDETMKNMFNNFK
mgnify:CR=1 FL=1